MLIEFILRHTRHKNDKIGHFISETFPKPISWLGMEKINLTQQKHTLTNQNKCKFTTTQNKNKKLKPGLVASYDIRPGNEESPFGFRRFINLSLTYLTLTHTLTASDPHGARTHVQLTLDSMR